ncbi:MAG TPA: hypothetical protein VME66_14165 [Candidatus Acidoferrales bacterium]|nr:hypothetical protein [Candidatus Acidoferrales bacterium]
MKMQSRRSRRIRQVLLKTGIWVFLVVFVASVVGVAIVIAH